MLVSLLIANHNNGQFFKECFESILVQTYTNWEVIIIDDCSTDDSVALIRGVIGDDERFHLFINEKNRGCGYTKRKCAEIAKGIICGFLDPDDAITPDALQLMVEEHMKHPNVALVHSTFYYCDENLQPAHAYDKAGQVLVTERFINSERKVTAFATYKNSYYKKTGGIDPFLLRAVDQDIYLKLSETGEFHFIGKPLYYYRMHDKGISTASSDKALYWYLKVVVKAEERRKINLENEVGAYLNRTDPQNLAINLSNPRYLLLRMRDAFRKKPSHFLKKLLKG